ncbi:MAG: hypothetical protein NTY15_17050 [Planctomycetota bacterium]|nr:hypothetical protein [Planctomycetota bacterium]
MISFWGKAAKFGQVTQMANDKHGVRVTKQFSMATMTYSGPTRLGAFFFAACFAAWMLVISCQTDCFGQIESVPDSKIAELVSRLSSSEFAVRESATEQLSLLDEKRLSELELAFKGLSKEELEARIRLSGIIAKLKNDRMEFQTKRFLRSNDPEESYGFDGWRSFSRVAGNSRNSKKLFLKMSESYPELVFATLQSKKEALDKAKEIATSISQKLQNLAGYEIPDALALLYCFNVADDLTDRSLERFSARVFNFSPFGPFLLDPQFRKSLERLLAGWSMQLEVSALPQCLAMFVEKDFVLANDVARKLLESEQIKSEPLLFIRSMQAVYRFGTKTDLPFVEKWLDDTSLCLDELGQGVGNPLAPETYTAEYRDVALLVSMHLAGEDFMPTFPKFQPTTLWGFREESVLLPTTQKELRNRRIDEWKSKRKKG